MCDLCLECAQPCKQVCLECAQPCKQVCAGCQVARYCSKECARKCWSEHHRHECSRLVRAQIVNHELMELSGMRGTKHLETLALDVGVRSRSKSRHLGKRMAGFVGEKKQARCNGGNCANPGAVGIRYVCYYDDSELHLLDTPAFGKLCACAHAVQNHQRWHRSRSGHPSRVAGESCWIQFLHVYAGESRHCKSSFVRGDVASSTRLKTLQTSSQRPRLL